MENNTFFDRVRKVNIVKLAILLVIVLVSVFVLRPMVMAPESYADSIRELDEKKDTVVALVGASTLASYLISAIPDDTATPIAEKLTDLSVILLFILSVIFAEKYLLPVFGGITCVILVPAICILFMLFEFDKRKHWMRQTAFKLIALAIALMTLIPAGILTSNTIEATFKTSIDESIEAALNSQEELKAMEEEEVKAEEQTNFFDAITNTAKNVVSNVMTSVENMIEKAKSILGYFVEAIAILLITDCVMPMIVLVLYIFIIKYIFGQNINISNFDEQKPFGRFRGKENGDLLLQTKGEEERKA